MGSRSRRTAARRAQRVRTDAGMEVRSLGVSQEFRKAKPLPMKVAGRHRWMAVGSWSLSDNMVRHAFDPEVEKLLDLENLVELGIGCWDCEQVLTPELLDTPCPAPASPD